MAELIALKKDRYKMKKTVWKVVLYVVMIVVAICLILPFYWSIITSFRPADQILDVPIKLYPNSFTWEHYQTFFTKSNVFLYYGNTFLVIAIIIIADLLTCSLAAYSLSRLEYKGKAIILKIFYASMMIPGIITLIPQFLVVETLGMGSSLLGIIVPAMISIYGVLFLRSFFLSTPKEIAEAARIDGAGELRIYFTLYLRMIMPGLVTLALFTFNSNWNSYLWPSIIVGNDESQWLMAIALKEFTSLNAENYGAMMAGSIITVVPSILIFLIGQRYFLENLTFAGIK